MIDENSTFGGFLTTIGEAKQANANALKTAWKLTHLLLGDANGSDPVPAPDQTQLVNQVYRAAINQLSIDPDNPGILIAEVVLPPTIGGWWIRELGIEDEDGDFVAVANCPPSYKPLLAQGSGRNQVVRMHLILSNTANVELKVDPSVVLATREYVDSTIENSGVQFANYDPDRVYTTGEVTRGSDGYFYEFYDRDQNGTVQGLAPTISANRPHIWMRWDGNRPGQVIEWRSETLPEGYIENDGSEVNRKDYRRIFAAIGTTWGDGDGATTFNLPDDRGEFKRGWDHGRGVDSGRALSSHQNDAIRNITASISALHNTNIGQGPTGAFYLAGHIVRTAEPEAVRDSKQTLGFDASRVVPTATENRSRNNAAIYLTKI